MALSANEYARIASVGLADGPSEPSLSSAGDSGAAAARRGRALADRYRIERELGACGMATVYLAHDLKHDRDVALKVLHPDLAATIGPDRFLSEIRVTANLQHPNILGLFDSGVADGQALYVGKFNQGRKYGAARGATFRERGGARCSQSVVDSRDWRGGRRRTPRAAPIPRRGAGASADALVARVAEALAAEVLVSTVSHCHGALAVLELGEPTARSVRSELAEPAQLHDQ